MGYRMRNTGYENQFPGAYKQPVRCALGTMKVPFLALPIACVPLGVVTTARATGAVNIWHALLVLIGALAAHVCVNAHNEYCDFRSGLDARTTRTPFSGGSGVLPEHPEMAWVGLVITTVSLTITVAVGLFFLKLHGMALLPIGLLGLLLIIAYTPHLTHQMGLCLIAPGLGFGPLMVVGTQVALTGRSTPLVWIASLVPFFLVNNLLLLNQFPDMEADRSVGRKHALVVLGPKRCSIIYTLFLIAAYSVIMLGVVLRYLPPSALLGLVTILIAIPTVRGVLRYHADIPHLIPYLGMNVLINLTTPVLLAIGLLLN